MALVIDAGARDEIGLREQADFLQESLGQAAADTRFEIFIAVPTLEVLFFEPPTFVERLAHQHFSQAEWRVAKLQPKQFLHESLGENALVKILENLDDQTIKVIRKHPLSARALPVPVVSD